MKNVLDVLPADVAADSDVQSLRIAQAYAAVFTGAGSRDDAELVLVDMAIFTRYYDTAMFTMPPDQVKALDQRRAVFQRVLEAMTHAGAEPVGLLRAVLSAPPIDTIEELAE